MEVFEQEQFLPITREQAWEFFSRPRNLEKITPPEMGFEITSCRGEQVYEGQVIAYRVKVAPLVRLPWVSEIKAVVPGESFVDDQIVGPYRIWIHQHSFADAEGGVLVKDLVHWQAPFEPLSWPVKVAFVRPKVAEIFAHRKEVLAAYFAEDGEFRRSS
ncbi:MAG: SRPBCC family protein [Verrucomicrobiota bacterium]